MEEAEGKPRICDTCSTTFESECLLQYHRLSCRKGNGTTVPENSVEKEPQVTDRKAEDDGDDDDGAQYEDEEDYEIEVNESEEMESDYDERINMEEDDDNEEGNEETVFKPDNLDEKPFTCNLCYLVFAKLEAYNGHMDMHLNGLLPQQQSTTDTSFEQIKLVVNKGMKEPIILKGKEVLSTGCKSEDPDEKPFTCNLCLLAFLGSDAYDAHMDMHLNGQLPVKGGVTIVAPVEPITLVVPNDKNEASEPITLTVANGKKMTSEPISPVVPNDKIETCDDKGKMKQDLEGTVSFSGETEQQESTNVKEEGEEEAGTGTGTGSAGTRSGSELEEMDLKPLTCNLCYLAFTDVETYNTHMDMHLNGQLPGRRPEYIQQEVGIGECEEEISPSEEKEEKPFVWEQWASEIPGTGKKGGFETIQMHSVWENIKEQKVPEATCEYGLRKHNQKQTNVRLQHLRQNVQPQQQLKATFTGSRQGEALSVRLLRESIRRQVVLDPAPTDAHRGAGPERRGTSLRFLRQGAQEQKQSHQTHGDTHWDKEEHMHLLWQSISSKTST